MPWALAISLTVFVGAAWLARLIASSGRPSSQSPATIG